MCLATLFNGALKCCSQLVVGRVQVVGFIVCLCSWLPHLQSLCRCALPKPGLQSVNRSGGHSTCLLQLWTFAVQLYSPGMGELDTSGTRPRQA